MDKINDSELKLQKWMKYHGVKNVNDFVFDGTCYIREICNGYLNEYYIVVLPMRATHDIGKGEGVPLKITF